ncbi:MAG: RES family NAD+ phosphorylase [Gammaproteobacteria bacterium]
MSPPLARVRWAPCWRLVSSRFPPAALFDRVSDPEDLDAVFYIEGLTNDRLREEAGDLSRVSPQDRIAGPGSTPVMAAFTHLNPEGSRFTDGSYGVYYGAYSIDTAIAETRFHRERFLAMTDEPPLEIDMRAYASDINADLHDVRGAHKAMPEIYDPDPSRYGPAQALASRLRGAGSNGIVYDSVRDPGGQCLAIFRPLVLSPVTQGPHFCYVWDGQAIIDVYEKRRYEPASG